MNQYGVLIVLAFCILMQLHLFTVLQSFIQKCRPNSSFKFGKSGFDVINRYLNQLYCWILCVQSIEWNFANYFTSNEMKNHFDERIVFLYHRRIRRIVVQSGRILRNRTCLYRLWSRVLVHWDNFQFTGRQIYTCVCMCVCLKNIPIPWILNNAFKPENMLRFF